MPAITTSTGAMSPSKKFSTVSALSGKSSDPTMASAGSSNGSKGRVNVKGLFDTPLIPEGNGKAEAKHNTLFASKRAGLGADAAASVSREDGPWSVSVAEAPQTTPATEKRDALRKKTKPTSLPQLFTLYVTTPTHNITLMRSAAEIVELDARLRESQSSNSTLPALPNLPNAPQPPVQTSRKILQTITRTLSPSGHKNRTGISQISAVTGASDSTASSSLTASPHKSSPVASASLSPAREASSPIPTDASTPSITSQLASYFTTLSNLAPVKRHKNWKRFIRVRADDLESIRVERRVRKIRSDLAQHVKSPVAPANVNVTATPSQSDIGEEGGRTDDDRSFSGRSTSHSFRQDRQDASARSASTDGERSNREEQRKNPNFAGIPEESERNGDAANELSPRASGSKSQAGAAATAKSKRDRRSRKRSDDRVTVDDYDMIRVLGKGCAGKVLLVRHKPTKGLFAMKSIHKRHVLAHQELQHTLTEQAVLKRMAKEVMDPFVVKLWWSFHDVNNLYLIMDFHPGGDLATQLSRWGRLGRDRARFYAAEIVEGVEGLHRAGVIYRDLKPENVLIGVDGHIVLSDFGLSKEFPVRPYSELGMGSSTPPPPGSPMHDELAKGGRSAHYLTASDDARSATSSTSGSDAFPTERRSRSRWMDDRDVTTTFCGTAEYLAPEVIQGAAYSYEVDWWSFGTMLYEMLTGITPFWADTHADMYVRVLHDDLVFPDDRVLDQDTKSILRGLLQRNPMLRMKEPRIKKHPYFSMIEWDHVFHKRYIPPYIPPINPLDETDTQNFDETFLDMKPVVNGADDGDAEEEVDANDGTTAGEAKAASQPAADKNVDAVVASNRTAPDGKSLFDGYSFRGRRDSGSIRSSNLSNEPSDGDLRPALDDESDDDNAAARAAVAVLDHLERQAAESEAALSSPPPASSSTRPTATKESSGGDALPETPTKTRGGQPTPAMLTTVASGTRQPATIAEAEREDDDGEDDWDMVDAPSANEPFMSELNGGKGANLFARGVVDTYRLLRRQESSRLPLAPSYSGKTFNRLSRKPPRASPRRSGKISGTNVGDNGRNGSAVSLGAQSNGANALTSTASADQSSASLGLTPASNAVNTDEASQTRKAASPSLASSDEVNSQQDKAYKQRMKKMKRFTNFFETSR